MTRTNPASTRNTVNAADKKQASQQEATDTTLAGTCGNEEIQTFANAESFANRSSEKRQNAEKKKSEKKGNCDTNVKEAESISSTQAQTSPKTLPKSASYQAAHPVSVCRQQKLLQEPAYNQSNFRTSYNCVKQVTESHSITGISANTDQHAGWSNGQEKRRPAEKNQQRKYYHFRDQDLRKSKMSQENPTS